MTDVDYYAAKNAESIYGGFAVQQAQFRRELKIRKNTFMMRAKFNVTDVVESKNDQQETTLEQIKMMAVSSKPFDKDGNSEDNSFARWTPSGELAISITNPNLFGKIKTGQAFYLDFTPADS